MHTHIFNHLPLTVIFQRPKNNLIVLSFIKKIAHGKYDVVIIKFMDVNNKGYALYFTVFTIGYFK